MLKLPHHMLKLGDKGSEVLELKLRLSSLHLLSEGDVSDVYDEATKEAVKEFQGAHHLQQDGIVGHHTLPAINHATAIAHSGASSVEQDHVIRSSQYNVAPSVEEYREAWVRRLEHDVAQHTDNHGGKFTGGQIKDEQGKPIPWCAGYASHERAEICKEASGGKIHLPVMLGARANGEKFAASLGAYHTKSHLDPIGSGHGYKAEIGDSLVLARGEAGLGHITKIVGIDMEHKTYICIGGNEPPHFCVEKKEYPFNDPKILGVIDEGKIYEEECKRHGLTVARNPQDFDAQVASRKAVSETNFAANPNAKEPQGVQRHFYRQQQHEVPGNPMEVAEALAGEPTLAIAAYPRQSPHRSNER